VPKRELIGDRAFPAQLIKALRERGELGFVVLWVQGAGRKDWYLARDQAGLETVLRRIRPIGPWGYSDRIEIFATREFPFRKKSDHEWLRAKARKVLDAAGEVVLARGRDGDPELQAAETTDHVETINESFSEPHEGERLVGAHPFRHPDGTPGVFVAWNLNQDGEIRAGAY
jgi:hypothetical protein